MQQFKLGELVGEKTVGAANTNRYVGVAPGFVLSISYGRPVHPIGGKNWEGEGVEPTVVAPSAQALEVAQALALQRFAEQSNVSAEDRAEYEWAKVAAEARLNPVTIASARMKALAGRYGSSEVIFRDGLLWLTRPDRPTARLTPLTADGLFAVHPSDRLRAPSLMVPLPAEPPEFRSSTERLRGTPHSGRPADLVSCTQEQGRYCRRLWCMRRKNRCER